MYNVYAVNKEGKRVSYAGKDTLCKTYREAYARLLEHFRTWQKTADLMEKNGVRIVIVEEETGEEYASLKIHFEGYGKW